MSSLKYAIGASWVVPMERPFKILNDHALVIDGDTIETILPMAELSVAYPDMSLTWLDQQVLLPGLINMHTHSAMSLMRGVADDLPLKVWLEQHIWPIEGQLLKNKRYISDGVRLAMLEYIRGGITTYNDSYFFPDVAAEVTKQAGMRAWMGMPVINFPTPWAANTDEYFSRGIELHQQVIDDPLIHTAFAPHAPYSVDDAAFIRMRDLAEEMNIPIHLHLLETAGEVTDSINQYGLTPMQRLEKLGLLSPLLLAVHMTALDDNDIKQVAHYGVNVVHCPESNLKLASGMCPVHALHTAGVNICVGTDGAASNNDLDLLGEVRTAALLAKGYSGNAEALPAAEALATITINAARALGKDDQIGSLKPGKKADICSIDLSAPDTQPIHNIYSQLIYATSRQQVENVWVAGRQLMRERELLTLDMEAIQANALEWREQIQNL